MYVIPSARNCSIIANRPVLVAIAPAFFGGLVVCPAPGRGAAQPVAAGWAAAAGTLRVRRRARSVQTRPQRRGSPVDAAQARKASYGHSAGTRRPAEH